MTGGWRVTADTAVEEKEVPVQVDGVTEFLRASTREIWDEQMLGSVGRYFSANAVVHLPGGVTHHGSEQVLTDLVTWLAAFSDTRLFVDDVIWSEDSGEYRTSVRETIVGHHTGFSRFGPPTGRRVVVGRIVNSRIRNERFVEQWIEWDEAGLVRQLGLDADGAMPGAEDAEVPPGGLEDLHAGTTGWDHHAASSPRTNVREELAGADLVKAVVTDIWNGRLPGATSHYYDAQYRAQVAGRRIFGREEVQGGVLAMLAGFPDLHLHVDDILCRERHDGQHTATRWTLLGTNSGPSPYGPPSNRLHRLTGITHHHICDSRLQEGWTQFSELSLLRQMAAVNKMAVERDINE